MFLPTSTELVQWAELKNLAPEEFARLNLDTIWAKSCQILCERDEDSLDKFFFVDLKKTLAHHLEVLAQNQPQVLDLKVQSLVQICTGLLQNRITRVSRIRSNGWPNRIQIKVLQVESVENVQSIDKFGVMNLILESLAKSSSKAVSKSALNFMCKSEICSGHLSSRLALVSSLSQICKNHRYIFHQHSTVEYF